MRPFHTCRILYLARTIRRAFDFGINESVKCMPNRILFFSLLIFLYYCYEFIFLLLYGYVLPAVYGYFHDDDDRKVSPISSIVFTIVSRFLPKKKVFYQKN